MYYLLHRKQSYYFHDMSYCLLCLSILLAPKSHLFFIFSSLSKSDHSEMRVNKKDVFLQAADFIFLNLIFVSLFFNNY